MRITGRENPAVLGVNVKGTWNGTCHHDCNRSKQYYTHSGVWTPPDHPLPDQQHACKNTFSMWLSTRQKTAMRGAGALGFRL